MTGPSPETIAPAPLSTFRRHDRELASNFTYGQSGKIASARRSELLIPLLEQRRIWPPLRAPRQRPIP